MEPLEPPSDAMLDRYLAGECGPGERDLMRTWLAADPQRSVRLEELRRTLRLDTARAASDTSAAWAELQRRIAVERSSTLPAPLARRVPRVAALAPRPWLAGRRRVAAIVLVMVGAAGTGVVVRMRAPSAVAIATRAGEQKAVRLDDGSLARLGPASTLRYRLTGDTRTVELEGLAQFTVVHDASRPFVVRAGNTTTTDVGTEFVVRAYPGSAIDVAVSSGRVAIDASASGATGGASSSTIDAGQRAHISPDGVIRRSAVDGDGTMSAWLAGGLAFHEASVAEVAAELSRWYDVEVRVADSVLARRRVTATYASPTLHGVLDAIAASLGARYEQRGRRIIMSGR